MTVHPVEIKQRSLSVFLSSVLTFVVIVCLHADFYSIAPDISLLTKCSMSLDWLGLSLNGTSAQNEYETIANLIWMLFRVWLLNSILFMGEIYILIKDFYQEYYNQTKHSNILAQQGVHSFPHFLYTKLIFGLFKFIESEFTNHYNWPLLKQIVIAPIVEEIYFRGIVFGLYRDTGFFDQNPQTCIVVLPIYFAVAHAHQIILKRNEQWPVIKREMIIGVFRIIYTQVFGIYSGWVYIKTGSLWSAILLHSHCNFFGVPNFGLVFNSNIYLPKRIVIGVMYIVGTIGFFSLKNYIL